MNDERIRRRLYAAMSAAAIRVLREQSYPAEPDGINSITFYADGTLASVCIGFRPIRDAEDEKAAS